MVVQVPQPQPEAGVTYAHKLEKGEALLDPTRPAAELERRVRALYPWPIAEIELAGERVRVHGATLAPDAARGAPGDVVAAGKAGIDAAWPSQPITCALGSACKAGTGRRSSKCSAAQPRSAASCVASARPTRPLAPATA